MMEITLIGTGALQPLPGRALASAAVTLAGRVLLLDCGEGTQAAAKAAGVSLMKIDAIALTHYHGDHTFGLPGLLQSMGMAGRTEPVWIFGPQSLQAQTEPLRMLCPHLPFALRMMEMNEAGISLGALMAGWPQEAVMTPVSTEHRVPSCGYRLELRRAGRFLPERAGALGVPVREWKTLQHGGSVLLDGRVITPDQVLGAPRRGLVLVYTGDTAPCDAVTAGAKDADLLICEATYGEDGQAELAAAHGHMTFSQAAHTAAQAGVRELWLTHYSPMIADPHEYEQNARRVFERTVCGEDAMKTTLRFDGE